MVNTSVVWFKKNLSDDKEYISTGYRKYVGSPTPTTEW